MTKTLDIASLAEEIRRAHDAVGESLTSALPHAHRAGGLLLQVKATLPHGALLPWLAGHCPTLSARTAQAYMRVAGHAPGLDANAPGVAGLPLRTAIVSTAEPEPPTMLPPEGEPDLEIDWDARFELYFALSDDLQAEQDDLAARHEPSTTEAWAELVAATLRLATRRQELNVAMIRDFGQFVRTLSAESGIHLPQKWSMFDESLQPFFEKLRPLERREDVSPGEPSEPQSASGFDSVEIPPQDRQRE